MGKRVDHTGKRFGQLTVQSAVSSADKTLRWLCLCDCGVRCEVRSQCLVKGSTKSCGCLRKSLQGLHNKKEQGRAGQVKLYSNYRNGAKYRGLSFEIAFDDFVGLTVLRCFYCGCLPGRVSCNGKNAKARQHSAFVYNGLDRIDGNVGYNLSNVVTCCASCNLARRDIPQDEFIAWIARAYLHLHGTRQ